MNKLPISVGILSWNSSQVLAHTLMSYKKYGLMELVEEVTIFFQEIDNRDVALAKKFKIPYIGNTENIGIGRAFTQLAENASQPYFLPLEHDFELIESKDITRKRLLEGMALLQGGMDMVRYRHRKKYGEPLFSRQVYEGKELEIVDRLAKVNAPHLLDCVHWIDDPETRFEQIVKEGDYFITSARWANWTNNPSLLRPAFYLEHISPFSGEAIQLEENLASWWSKQSFMVAQGEGLFKHNDFLKYPEPTIIQKIVHRLKVIARMTR